jgi:hypothetical protein
LGYMDLVKDVVAVVVSEIVISDGSTMNIS